MKYGFYDAKRKEYVITNPKTPTSWINYLGTARYCSIISANAGGFSFIESPKNGRFTRFRYHGVPMDRPGKYIYLDDGKKIWSASWQPVGASFAKYKTYHGMGYTRIESETRDFFSETTYFVPLNKDMEVWDIKLINKSKKIKKIKLTAYTEFAFWNTMLDLIDFQYTLNIAKVFSYKKDSLVLYKMLHNTDEKNVYFTWNLKSNDICNNREKFLGLYNDESRPDFVFNKKYDKNFSDIKIGGLPVAALQSEIILGPKQEKYITILLGLNGDIQKIKEIKKYFNSRKNIKKEKKQIALYWKEKQEKFQISYQDSIIENMINDLNLYQSYTTFNWSRSASMYESGTFRDGLGFRDSCQDLLAIISIDPQNVKKRLLDLSEGLYTDGSAAHTYQPLTGEGSGGHDYSDDHLWFPFALTAYIRETNDIKILNKKTTFIDNRSEKETLAKHIEYIFQYAFKKRGQHGLSLGLHADWNDCLNLQDGESVWTTELFYKALSDYIEMLEFYGIDFDLKKLKKYQNTIKKSFDQYAWDGEWFLRGFTGKGMPIGSKKSKKGKIYLNSNTWAIFSGLADKEKAKKSMESVHKYLFSKYGLKLLAPPYNKVNLSIGSITSYPEGMKENAGIFSHTNPWAVIASTLIDDSEKAMLYYKTLIPLLYEDEAELRLTEPYVYTQFIAGPDSPNFGEAKNSWLTGTSSWSYVSFTQFILGIRPYFKYLILDPKLPLNNGKVKIKRQFQNAVYNIEFQSGKENILVIDGKKQFFEKTPIHIQSFKDKKNHNIRVIIKTQH